MVGLRYKGSIGAWVGCLSGPDPFDPSGSKQCTKLSMKVKFNWEQPDTEFHGLRRLQFHSQNLDDTQFHERLGYWVFGAMDVPAPRSVHGRVIVNGTYLGLFAVTEEIDGRFTRDRFADGRGNLYKEVWPVDAAGQPHPAETYLAGLRTNEDENPTAELIAAFGRDLAAAEDRPARAAVLEKYTDVEELLRYVAVDRTIRHDDGPMHWYCFEDPCSNHNFYWYEDPSTRRLHLVAWDLDNAFENIPFDRNPVTPVADDFLEIRNGCEPFPHGQFRIPQRSATCDALFDGLAHYAERYEEIRQELLAGPLSARTTDTLLNRWSAQLADATSEAADAHEDALRVRDWETAVEALRRDLEFAREN